MTPVRLLAAALATTALAVTLAAGQAAPLHPPPPFNATSDSSTYPSAVQEALLADAVPMIVAAGLGDRLTWAQARPVTAAADGGDAAPPGPRLGPPIPLNTTGAVSNADMWASSVRAKFAAIPASGAAAVQRADADAGGSADVAAPAVTVADVRALRGRECEIGRNSGCVTSVGGRLSVGGKPWSAAGTNAFYLASLTAFGVSDQEIVAQIAQHAAAGANLLRVWFCNEYTPAGTMQALAGFKLKADLERDTLARLDFVMAACAAHGIRVVGVLSNYWPFEGGWQAWVDTYSVAHPGTGKRPIEAFLTSPGVRDAFKIWLRKIVTRVNTVTGLPYDSDPTLAFWELANEPHTTDGWEAGVGLAPGTTLCAWVGEMSSFIATLSSRMISTGEEGYTTNTPTADHSWIGNGLKGVDYTCNVGRPAISVAVVHVYPNSWKIANVDWLGPNFIAARAATAAAMGKPFILEEYGGFGVTAATNPAASPTRDALFTFLTQTAEYAGADASLVWAVAPRTRSGALPGNDSPCTGCPAEYVFTYADDGGAAVRAANARAEARRRVGLGAGVTVSRSIATPTAGKLTAPASATTTPQSPLPATLPHPTLPTPKPSPTPPRIAIAKPTPSKLCTDEVPTGSAYTCAQHAMWGRCSDMAAAGACLKTCAACCTDVLPAGTSFTCPQQAAFGKCNEKWMAGRCMKSCGAC